MSFKSEFNENETRGQTRKFWCQRCSGNTKHEVLHSTDHHYSEILEPQRGFSVDGVAHYQIIQCLGCEEVSFNCASWFSENEDIFDDGWSYHQYPERVVQDDDALFAKTFHKAPHKIRRIYQETIDAFNNESFTLCAAGLRALLEGICADKKVAGGSVTITKSDGSKEKQKRNNLEGKISGLHEEGVLAANHANALHGHRFLGNEALHELSQPSSDKLRTAIEIIEHTLEELYVIPNKAQALKST